MNEVCPSCGDFVRALLEVTGWCSSCSYRHGRECHACGELKAFSAFSRDKTRKDGRRPVCRDCDARLRRERNERKAAIA